MKSVSFHEYIAPVFIAMLVIGSSMFAVVQWSDDLVQRTLMGHAESSATNWRNELTTSVPEIATLFEQSDADPAQIAAIAASMAGSDIFRFEAFNPAGALTYVSDKALFEVEEANMFNATSAQVAVSGLTIVEVEDGRQKSHRPDYYVEAYMPFTDASGGVVGVVEVYVDVSGLALALRSKFNNLSMALLAATAVIYLAPTLLLIGRNKQLREQDREMLLISKRDPLTGLWNRGAFNEQLALLFAPNSGSGSDVGLLFIDLDKFKEINDLHGHDQGDNVLKAVTSVFKESTRKGDFVARLGGDEFVIVSPDSDFSGLEAIGNRLMELTAQPLLCNTTQIDVGLSVGVHLSRHGESERRALHRADLALYWAKANGRGQVAFYSDELEKKEIRRRCVESDVRTGLEEKRFFLEYQPIFDKAQRIVGFEALLRLHSRDGESIAPDEFIPIAEDSGLIEDLGGWVLKTAIEAARDWPKPLFVAVNISANQFRAGTLASELLEALETSGLEGHRVCLELTERVLLRDRDNVVDQLATLKGLGVQIAIDDFGTGYSSLSYLWQYEFHRLKIDKSFFEAYPFDKARNAKIIETIITLGHQFDMTVTIEGIEMPDQLELIQKTHCDYLQGFLLSKPVSESDAKAMSLTNASAA